MQRKMNSEPSPRRQPLGPFVSKEMDTEKCQAALRQSILSPAQCDMFTTLFATLELGKVARHGRGKQKESHFAPVEACKLSHPKAPSPEPLSLKSLPRCSTARMRADTWPCRAAWALLVLPAAAEPLGPQKKKGVLGIRCCGSARADIRIVI